MSDSADLDAAHDRGAVVLTVDDGVVRDIVGDAPLAAVVRLDGDMALLADEVNSLRNRLLDVFEFAADHLARATDLAEHDHGR